MAYRAWIGRWYPVGVSFATCGHSLQSTVPRRSLTSYKRLVLQLQIIIVEMSVDDYLQL